jgi:glycosyltransferase involved in cell wall biosynthesis
MLASVVISSYNYARFLAAAVDSALGQTYPEIEVVVADDGSTDGSREILAGYGERIVAVLKENGGLASAVNAGLAASHGEVVFLLDADDLFVPGKVAAVMDAFQAEPRAAVAYHPLRAIDANDVPIGRAWPRAVWHGEIRRRVERSGGWWPHPTTSALAFRRSFADKLMPIPPPNRTIYPDTFLAGPAAFVGPVLGLREPLGLFRLHGQNMSYWGRERDADDPAQIREKHRRSMQQYADEFRRLRGSLDRLGIAAPRLSLADHYLFLRHRRAAGYRVALGRIVATALRCPALPPQTRITEAVNILIGRW